MSQQAAPSKPHWSRLRLASLGILSGLFVGILMGIAARIAMRIAALVVDQEEASRRFYLLASSLFLPVPCFLHRSQCLHQPVYILFRVIEAGRDTQGVG